MATIMSSGVDDDTHSTTSVGEVACFDGGEGDGGHPQVTLSFAQSLDGSITAQRGLAVALSSPESFRMTHSLRARHDAIAVGVGTLLSDNPSLNTRLVQGEWRDQLTDNPTCVTWCHFERFVLTLPASHH
jgi:hypothetical protein